MEALEDTLLKFWGHSSFRPLQKEIIQSVLNGNDTLALLPTGGGKSLCFQIPAIVKEGLCLVVSPLIALMNDQVDHLKKKGIKAMAITSAMSKAEIEIAFTNCIYGNYKFLYISPERLQNELFQKKLHALKVVLIAVDEAHCISQWGYDFRPSYLHIAKLREWLPETPLIALTASATKEVVEDIQAKLLFKNAKVFRSSFERKNLHYIVQFEENKFERLLKICRNIKGTGIVYTRNRKKTQEIASYLQANGITANYYHAGLLAEQRLEKQYQWIGNKVRVMVATNAFGMGIDKADVRFVVHVDIPDSIEAYFQEAGRAGRDGKTAYAISLVQALDTIQLSENINTSFPTQDEMKVVYQSIVNYYQVAVGAGQGLSVDFNMDEICDKYNLKHQQVFNSIRFLEKEGYLSFSDISFEPSKLFIKVNKEELYNFQVKHVKYDLLIKTILRSYGGVMEQYAPLNEFSLAKRCGITKQELEKQLNRLHDLEIVDYLPRQQLPRILFTENRTDVKHLHFSKDNYSLLKQKAIERVNSISHYVNETKICRSRMLLNYFNEDEFEDCGHCDICLEKKRKQRTVDTKEIKLQIQALLHHKPYKIDDLVSSLYRYQKEKVIETINEMLDDREIIKNQQHYISANEKVKSKKP